MSEEALARYVALLESVREQVPPLEAHLTEDVRFRDPFNDLAGLVAYRRVLEDMLEHVGTPRFTVTHAGMAPGRSGQPSIGLLRWQLTGTLLTLGGRHWTLDGTSEVGFATDGRVNLHVDFWDAAGGLYEQLPVLGRVLAMLRRRIAVGSIE